MKFTGKLRVWLELEELAIARSEDSMPSKSLGCRILCLGFGAPACQVVPAFQNASPED